MEGFEIRVEEYCRHCDSFIPEDNCVETTWIGDEERQFKHTITCRSSALCKRISEFHRKRLERD